MPATRASPLLVESSYLPTAWNHRLRAASMVGMSRVLVKT